jgi:AraC-like DNA-binding protein
MSAGHLSRQFRLAYGESPYAYLMTRRIERAMALLRGTDLSVTDICFAVGCSSLGAFSTRFTEFVGVPPSTSRQRTRGATADMPACVARQVTQPGQESRSAGRGRREVPAKLARQVRMLPADHGHKDDEADALSSVSPRSPLHGWTPSPSTRPPPCCGN